MKIALITGASSGIGREFAVQIAKLYRNLDEIWVTARRAERLEQLKKELDVRVKIYTGNLCDDEIYNKIEAALKMKILRFACWSMRPDMVKWKKLTQAIRRSNVGCSM